MNFVLLVGCLAVWSAQFASSLFYKSIHWNPRNPLFKFTPKEIKDGKAFVQKAVEPNSQVYFVCPNPYIIQTREEDSISSVEMYENIWVVDEDSFLSCNISNTNNASKRIFQCDAPLTLRKLLQVFREFSPTDDLVFEPGKKYYFIATSDGSKSSLNSTSGGHCNDTENGISMRIQFYICVNENDPKCNQTIIPTRAYTPTSIPDMINSEGRAATAGITDFCKYLAIGLGAALGVAIIVIIVLSCVVQKLKSQRKNVPFCLAEMQNA